MVNRRSVLILPASNRHLLRYYGTADNREVI